MMTGLLPSWLILALVVGALAGLLIERFDGQQFSWALGCGGATLFMGLLHGGAFAIVFAPALAAMMGTAVGMGHAR